MGSCLSHLKLLFKNFSVNCVSDCCIKETIIIKECEVSNLENIESHHEHKKNASID